MTRVSAALRRIPLHTAILLICFVWTLPTAGIFISSFRDPAAIKTTGWWTTLQHPFDFTQWTLRNYSEVLSSQNGMGAAFFNTLMVTIPATIIPITIAAFAAYAFSWMEFRGRYVMFVLVVGLMVVPLQMALIPILRLYV
ncbi:MAG TPA: carbohydrate ABC transporter permease, partial [Herpetosiphonaceae bacterium]|nr:carbohydrate ABC transporter permease [Herpetosiphonaceae bacterium]